MKVVFRRSFERDLRAISDRRTLDKVRYAIEAVEKAGVLVDIAGL